MSIHRRTPLVPPGLSKQVPVRFQTPLWRECVLAAWCVLVFVGIPSLAEATDRLVLRNLEIISDRRVAGFDEDGIRLDDGRLLTWDEVERGTVADQQEAFDRLLKELGEPLYRIRQRLAVGDHAGVLGHAESVYPRYTQRRSATAQMVLQGLTWARLTVGRRESALEAYLLAIEIMRNRGPAAAAGIPGQRAWRWNPQTGLSEELAPIWFDGSAATEALPDVGRAVGAMRKPWLPAVPLYYASLAIGAGDAARAASALSQFRSNDPVLQQLAAVLRAQHEQLAGPPGTELQRLRAEWEQYEGMNRALACLVLGRHEAREEDEQRRRDGILLLLRIPAVHGSDYPDLAAAALYDASRALEAGGDLEGSRILKNELLRRFSTTFHARSLQSQD